MSQNYRYEDDLGEWNIVYPTKVYDASVDRSKETKQQGFQSALALLGIGALLAFAFISSVLKTTFGLSSFWAALIVGIFILIIAIYIFRFGIFKEDAKSIEYENEDSANLGRFFELLTGSEDFIEVGKIKISCYKFSVGSYATCIRLQHGSATASKRRTTKYLMKRVADILGEYNLAYKQVVSGEVYAETTNCETYINSLNNVKYPQLQQTLMSIAQAHMDVTETQSLIDCTYLIIYAKSGYQRTALGSACIDLLNLLKQPNTVYRDVTCLSFAEYIEVLKYYHGVEVIDLSTIRITAPNKDILEQYKGLVSVIKIETLDNDVIRYPEEEEHIMRNNKLKKF